MHACDFHVSETHGKNAAVWNVLIHRVTQLGLWVWSFFFVFFFTLADLFSKIYWKCLSSKQPAWNGTLFLFSLFQLVLSPESSLDCICSTFILAVFFFFHWVWFLFCFICVMPLACSSSEYLHWLQQMEISQYKVYRGNSGVLSVVNDSL